MATISGAVVLTSKACVGQIRLVYPTIFICLFGVEDTMSGFGWFVRFVWLNDCDKNT